MTFAGWPAEAIEFYERLEDDNSRAFWHANREVYERCVRGPMDALLEELAAEFGEGRVFRPNRDVRFSADKSPYKTHIGATLAKGGYVQLSADGLAAGSGIYSMAADQLDRYRRAVASDRTGAQLAGLVATARGAGLDVTGHEMLKTAPRGYPKDHPRIELLRHKGLVTWRHFGVGRWLGTRAARDRVVEFLRASRPLVEWLDRNVGPPVDGPS